MSHFKELINVYCTYAFIRKKYLPMFTIKNLIEKNIKYSNPGMKSQKVMIKLRNPILNNFKINLGWWLQ